MCKRLFITIALVLLLCGSALGARATKKSLQFVDEFGDPITDVNSVTVYVAGASTHMSLYTNGVADVNMVNPVTTSSSNSTLTQNNGSFYFYSKDADYKITVENGTQSLTKDNLTGSDTRKSFYTDYIGTAASLSVNDDQDIVIGTDDDWNIDNNGTTLRIIPSANDTVINIGNGSADADIKWFAGTTTEFVIFDQSGSDIDITDVDVGFDDDAILSFGASDDIQFLYDASGDDLNISGNGLEIAFGSTGAGIDVAFWASSAGDFILFDEDADELVVEDVKVNVMDDTVLSFGDADDITIQYDEDGNNDLQVTGTVGFDGTVNFGIAGTGVDINMFGETSGDYIIFDQSIDTLSVVDIDVHFDDAVDVKFGSDVDFILESDTAKTLEVLPGAASDDYSVNLGVASSGVDLVVYGAGAANNVTFDASNNSLAVNASIDIGTNGNFTISDATPDIGGSSFWQTHPGGSSGQLSITDFEDNGGTLQDGQVLIIQTCSDSRVQFTGASGKLSCGYSNIVTMSGDMTTWIYIDSTWYLTAYVDASEVISMGTSGNGASY